MTSQQSTPGTREARPPLGRSSMYSVSGYGRMIADQVRMAAYAQALRQAVRPGSVVLDIGTGTGICALLACRFGARHVYAIEPDSAIQLARESAAANGYGDRITFIQDVSTRVTLSEPADVMVSDLRGVLPLFDHHLPAIADARRRLLAPGGTLIPRRDTLWVALAEAQDLYEQRVGPWNGDGFGFDLQAARLRVLNQWYKCRVTPEQLLTAPACWTTLDYATVAHPNLAGEVTWRAAREGTVHGLCVWFDAELADGVGFSNSPAAPELIYGSAFFPWSVPVEIAAGDAVSVALHADLVGEDYVWRWETRVLDRGDDGRPKAQFRQSTFFGTPLSRESLRRRAAGHIPVLHEDGEIDRFALAQMEGAATLEEIAERLAGRFPARFAGWREALTRAGELSQRYSR